MKNPECTELTPEEETKLMQMFSAYLAEEDEDLARKFFQPVVFFLQCE